MHWARLVRRPLRRAGRARDRARAPANGLVGSLPSQLGNLSKLATLRLSLRNALTGAIPDFLGALRDLQILHLDGNFLTGSISEAIPALPSLKELHLHRNRLSGSVPAQWASRSIESINLSTNSLGGTIPETLSGLPALREIRLAGNKLEEGCRPASLLLPVAETIDLRWNALSVEGDELLKFLAARSPDGDVLGTQTLPPTALMVSLFSPGVTLLRWQPPLYTANDGGYELTYRSLSGNETKFRFSPKTGSAHGFIGLASGTYIVSLKTYTSPHAANPNEVVSASTPPLPFTVTNPPLKPGSISFLASFVQFYSVAEGERAVVPVYRIGGTDGTVSVRARAVAGTAGLQDFESIPQLLSWSDGDGSLKFLQVPTIADNKVEGPEYVNLILDQPQGGATLGPLATDSLEILDSDVSGFGSDPVAADDPDGNGLFAWIAPEKSGTSAVFGRFADPKGRPVGDSFQISEESPDVDESNPGVVSVKPDHFEVVWQDKRELYAGAWCGSGASHTWANRFP